MQSKPNDYIEVEEALRDAEPEQKAYEDSVEGLLQYHADRSLWFKHQVNTAVSKLKRDYYQKKLEKNNRNLWKLLVRTPNAYNPLMEFINAPEAPEVATTGYAQVVDGADELEAPEISVTTESEVK